MPATLDSHCGLWVGASPHVVATDDSGNRSLCVFLYGSLVLTASPLGSVPLAFLVDIRTRQN